MINQFLSVAGAVAVVRPWPVWLTSLHRRRLKVHLNASFSSYSRWMIRICALIHSFLLFFQDLYKLWCLSGESYLGQCFSCSTGTAHPKARHHVLEYLGEDHLFLIGQITARISCSWGKQPGRYHSFSGRTSQDQCDNWHFISLIYKKIFCHQLISAFGCL